MMTQEQLIKEIRQLPPSDQRSLVSQVSRDLRIADADDSDDKFFWKMTRENKIGIAKALSGTFKPEGRYMPMTKEEDREIVMEYLEEKYR
ncbi:MAG: hypothetical protein ABL999_12940 [Pyrinomonadaceae bacterium]